MSPIEQFLEDHPEWSESVDIAAVPPEWDESVAKFPEIDGELDLHDRCHQYVMFNKASGIGMTRLALYVHSRNRGNSHKMAVSCAMQQSIGSQTNDSFWGGRKPFWEHYGEQYANRIRAMLAKRGVRLGENREYMPEIARFPGDPEAVVDFADGRSHIKSLLEKRGWGAEGAVNLQPKGPESDPHEPSVPVAENLVPSLASDMVRKDPSLIKHSKQELREMVYEKHGPSKTPKASL